MKDNSQKKKKPLNEMILRDIKSTKNQKGKLKFS